MAESTIEALLEARNLAVEAEAKATECREKVEEAIDLYRAEGKD